MVRVHYSQLISISNCDTLFYLVCCVSSAGTFNVFEANIMNPNQTASLYVHTGWLYDDISLLHKADDFSKRYFQMHCFLRDSCIKIWRQIC